MRLVTYINDLLYRYDCVIIPNFGGFVTREISARIDKETDTFYPPSKQLSFNSQLKNNDGLLANYISSVKQIPYLEAMQLIKKEVKLWEKTLQHQELELQRIGTLERKENSIVFEPSNTVNYLTSSYGLSSYTSKAIAQKETKVIPIHRSEDKKGIPAFIKYAASVAVLLALGTASFKIYKNNVYEQQVAEVRQQEKAIQEATFVIKNPIPAITLNVTKETYHYHIIAGAFRNPENAEKKVAELAKKGYDASILSRNRWGLTQVAYASFNDKREAINQLHRIQKNTNDAAWLLVADL